VVTGLLLKVDISSTKCDFYRSCSGILSYCKTNDVFVKLGLVKAYCLPLLTYCFGAFDLSDTSVRDLAVCWNDCFWKIFGYKRHESVKELQFFCGKLPLNLICNRQRWKFLMVLTYYVIIFQLCINFRCMLFMNYQIDMVVQILWVKCASMLDSFLVAHYFDVCCVVCVLSVSFFIFSSISILHQLRINFI